MTTQLKEDIKTIGEVTSFILLNVVLIMILESHSVVRYIFCGLLVICYGWYLWRRYFRKSNAAMFWFPTVNDGEVNLRPILFTIFILFFAAMGYFAFNMPGYFCLLTVAFAAIFCLFGFNSKPKGWVSIDNDTLKIFGLSAAYDVHALKEIVLKNDKIALTTIYGESSYSFQLRLNPRISVDLKRFLEQKLAVNGTLIIDAVKDEGE